MDIASAAACADERMAETVAGGVPSVAYGILLGGSLVHTGSAAADGYRLPTSTSPFRIASMTKSFTASTVLALRDRGALDLDDPITRWLPWADSVGLPSGSPVLRIRHLLTMTAGFPTDDPWGDRQESLPLDDFDRLVAGGLSFCRPPGMDFEYSNLGYALLGRVIARVAGEDYRDVVRSLLLEPLGMTSTTYDVDRAEGRMEGYRVLEAGLVEQPETPSGAFSPMGGLWSTVEDLARWVAFHEAAWADDPDAGPLDRWSRREMQRPHILARVDEGGAHSYGMGLYVTDDPVRGRFVHHSGGYPGFGSHMRWHPDTRWAIVGLANRTYAPMGKVCAEILQAIVEDDAPAAMRERERARLWPATRQAMEVAESLLLQWDDALVDRAGAMNLDLDQPRDERQRHWQRLTEDCGPFTRVADSVETRSPAHARWRMRGERGDVWLEVLLTPEREPRIQTLLASAATN
ncbi:MAG: serine hydrolase domain-containing protein [Candidatus Nanopelagicales bacterium]